MDPKNSQQFVNKDLANYWQNIDLYIGGSEHATGHLLYVRFWTKFLKDRGYIPVDEPANKLINQGMIQGRSNVVYKVVGVWGGSNLTEEESEEISNVISKLPELFISKGHYDVITKYNNLVESNTPIDEELRNKYNYISNEIEKKQEEYYKSTKSKIPKDDFWFSLGINSFVTQNVDVNIVQNDILTIEAFRKWRKYYENAEFILEDGKYICGVIDNEKMSKSKYNVVTPDSICEKFGADTLRLYEMFLGPLEQSKPWNTNGITGVHGFLKKLWRLFYQTGSFNVSNEAATKAELKVLHKTIKKVIEDIERFSFNTSVSTFMICVNELTDLKCNKRTILEPLLICLSPYAPHIAEELWKQLGHQDTITFEPFPECNESYLVDDSFNYPISFNGKTRFNLELAATLSPQEIESLVMAHENTIKYLDGKPVKKVIVVPKKIVNVVL